jgi:myo-inositol-1(or 4)-monophosphatase
MTLVSTNPEHQAILELARDLALRAGALQRERYETAFTIETKSAAIDLVTEVDRACEALIVEGIRRARPRDAILAEEGQTGEPSDGDDATYWIIDPLDGTTNFAHGFPRFCVSIGVEQAGSRVVGVVYDPLLDERFEALRGGGAWLGNRRLAVSREPELGRALVATGFAYDVHQSDDDNLASFARIVKQARGIRRDGSAALDLCYVAAGRLDGYWELKLKPWDVAAGLLIVEEAGGQTSDFAGRPAPRSGEEIVASNGLVHEALRDGLAPRPPRRGRGRNGSPGQPPAEGASG